MSALEAFVGHAPTHPAEVAYAAATASQSVSEDMLLTEAQVAETAGISVGTYRNLPEWDKPWTYWRSDVRRWAQARMQGTR